ncbi:hypothetical protein [Paenibacillus polymyxa]|jgi:hypothetical protein|uniref:hypothetical protein n=1 Tax=Paenibacillus polymyxa TaxID=1406 RepID=UPI002023E36A|nr:hypothetical protein [Paenibacillus polymyxa]MDU8672522.1 hypothetical protein [Paenibacillus polymyxa]MDU8697429.1 hypothetical protein [Paenibacillus polymyxa]URJ56592.1 hypothetical protein MF623_001263 [Paenibacillus polymyxa]URJ64022.1 hypothetical protein MF620_003646 [Paenibacillus polymyxa]URJ71102.1 hypothetical protein MF624_001254 [Paenibacillus polymyxa]
MTIVDMYTGKGTIVASHGEVWVIDDSCIPDVLGKIDRIELSIEQPEEMIGIYRIEHVMLFNEDDEPLYDDQDKVNNDEYRSEEELVKALAIAYGVSANIIETI